MGMSLLTRRRATWTDAEHVTAILDGLPVAAVACDLEMTIVYVTPFAAAMLAAFREVLRQRFRVDVDDLTGLNLSAFYPNPGAVADTLRTSRALPHTVEFDLGDRQVQLVANVLRRPDGVMIGYVATMQDVSRRHSASAALTGTVGELGVMSTVLSDATNTLGAAHDAVAGNSDALSTGMTELLDLMNSVADGAAMIRESTLAVVDSAHAAGGSVAELSTASSTISEFTAMISSIAEQTKLLALNATIEATRAGTAGLGFAVVAQEVKDLAQRAAGAAGQISAIVESIQRSSEAAGRALETITDKVDIVGSQQLSVNVIVDNQVAKVEEIVDITQDLAGAVNGLASAVGATTAASGSIVDRAQHLDGVISAIG